MIDTLPHAEQYAAPLMIYQPVLNSLLNHLRGLDWTQHLANHAGDTRQPHPLSFDGPIAVLDVAGPLSKYGSSIAPESSVLEMRRALRSAMANDRVSGVMLRVESGGGSSLGIADFADEIRSAAKEKPIHAYIEDIGASAAYWIASQANRLTANRSAMVGSIGTYMVLEDTSSAQDARGIKTHLIRAGRFKGVGTPGTAVSSDDMDDLQRGVNEMQELFSDAIATSRRLSKNRVESLADGRIHLAKQAKSMGLIDAVETFEEAMGSLKRSVAKPGATGSARSSASATQQWEAVLSRLTNEGLSRPRAIAQAASDHPDIHTAYLDEFNASHLAEHNRRRHAN